MKKLISYLIIIALISVNAFAYENIDAVLKDTANIVCNTVTEPVIGTVGGEWAIIGLARSGVEVPDGYFEKYYNNAIEYIKERNGVLHNRKYTEYSRVVIAMTAIGKNPADVGGYNMLEPLNNSKNTMIQGINGAAWALLALDCGLYRDENARETYINKLLERQCKNGGWALGTSDIADPDVTGMVLQALSNYKDRNDVSIAIEKALLCMSQMQDENGGFSSFGETTSESCIQMIIALGELGLALEDERFVKNGNSLADRLLDFYVEGKGFKHSLNGEVDGMATEQALYGLASIKLMQEGQRLYDITDDDFSKLLFEIYNVTADTMYGILNLRGVIQ